jgi:hypothetical protein
MPQHLKDGALLESDDEANYDINREMLGLSNNSSTPFTSNHTTYTFKAPEFSSVVPTQPIFPTTKKEKDGFVPHTPLPKGLCLLQHIILEHVSTQFRLVLHPEPSAHSIHLDSHVASLDISFDLTDLTPFGTSHATAINTCQVFRNARLVESQKPDTNAFQVLLDEGMNMIEIWVMHQPKFVYLPASGYALRGQAAAAASSLYEKQMYCIFAMRN